MAERIPLDVPNTNALKTIEKEDCYVYITNRLNCVSGKLRFYAYNLTDIPHAAIHKQCNGHQPLSPANADEKNK